MVYKVRKDAEKLNRLLSAASFTIADKVMDFVCEYADEMDDGDLEIIQLIYRNIGNDLNEYSNIINKMKNKKIKEMKDRQTVFRVR